MNRKSQNQFNRETCEICFSFAFEKMFNVIHRDLSQRFKDFDGVEC